MGDPGVPPPGDFAPGVGRGDFGPGPGRPTPPFVPMPPGPVCLNNYGLLGSFAYVAFTDRSPSSFI